MYRLWWLYVLLGLADLAMAIGFAVHRGNGWGVHFGLSLAQALCFGPMGVLYRREAASTPGPHSSAGVSARDDAT